MSAARAISSRTPESDKVAPITSRQSDVPRYRVPIPTPWTVWKSLPSDLIDGAMMISVS